MYELLILLGCGSEEPPAVPVVRVSQFSSTPTDLVGCTGVLLKGVDLQLGDTALIRSENGAGVLYWEEGQDVRAVLPSPEGAGVVYLPAGELSVRWRSTGICMISKE